MEQVGEPCCACQVQEHALDLSTSTSLSSVVLTKDISVPFLTWKSPEQPPASGQQKLSDAPLVLSMISQALLLFFTMDPKETHIELGVCYHLTQFTVNRSDFIEISPSD